MALATVLLLFVAFAGPTWARLEAFPTSLLDYAAALVPLGTGYRSPGTLD